jgi:hypothetical protein
LPVDGDGAKDNRKENLTSLQNVFSMEWHIYIYIYICIYTYTYTFNLAFLKNEKYKKELLLYTKKRNKGVLFVCRFISDAFVDYAAQVPVRN